MSLLIVPAPRFYCFSFNDFIVKIQCSSSGFLEIFTAQINDKFKKIQAKNPPSNREMFSFCFGKDSDSFYLTGGIGKSVYEFEIWKFSFSSSTWEKFTNTGKKISRRKCHSSVFFQNANRSIIYNIGGAGTKAIKKDLLRIDLNLNENTFEGVSYFNIDDMYSPRINCSAFLKNNTISVFGGLNEFGKVLGDLYEISLSIEDFRPVCTRLNQDDFSGRHSHISWKEEDSDILYIIDGMDDKWQKLDTVASFRGTWLVHSIFLTENPIIPHNHIFVEVTADKANEIKPMNILTALNPLFEELKAQQEVYTRSLALLKNYSDMQNAMIDSMKQVIDNPSELGNTFSGTDQMLKKQNNDLCNTIIKELSTISKSIEIPNSTKENNFKTLQTINDWIESEIEIKQKKHKKKLEEINTGKELSIKTIDALKKNLEITPGKETKEYEFNYSLDNFDEFLQSLDGMDLHNKNMMLDEFYSHQIIEFERLKDKNKKYKNLKSDEKVKQVLEDFSFITVSAIEDFNKSKSTFDTWNDINALLQKDRETAKQVQQIQKYTNNLGAEALQDKQTEITDAYNKLYAKKPEIEKMYKLTKQLRHNFKRNGHSSIVSSAPTLVSLYNSIFE